MPERRITPSLVISILALVIAIGGVSYAAIKIPKNSVGAKQLKRASVSTAKLKGGAVTAAKLKRNAVATGKLRNGSVNSAKVRNGSLVAGDLAPGVLPGKTWDSSRETVPLFVIPSGSLTTVVSSPVLPAGAYLASGRANILGSAASSTIICSLEDDAAQNFTVAAGSVFPLSMASTAILEEPRAIELKCSKSSGAPEIAQAHVIVTQVPGVTRIPADE
jgi:hypothetical protein